MESDVKTFEVKWTVSRGRETYGWNICTLWNAPLWGKRKALARCNGGNYDMEGTVWGTWLETTFPDRLRKLTKEYYGLTFHDPEYDPGTCVLDDGRTVQEAEAAGDSFGLDRYRAFYGASSKVPTERHRIPLIDGACGCRSMEELGRAIGVTWKIIYTSKNRDFYEVTIGPDPHEEQ